MRFVNCVALALLLVSVKQAVGLEPHPRQQYVVTAVLGEVPVPGSKREPAIRSNPQLMLLANEEAVLDAGGETELGEKKIPSGTLFKATVAPLNGKKVRVTGMLEVSSVGKADTEMVQRESFSVHFDK